MPRRKQANPKFLNGKNQLARTLDESIPSHRSLVHESALLDVDNASDEQGSKKKRLKLEVNENSNELLTIKPPALKMDSADHRIAAEKTKKNAELTEISNHSNENPLSESRTNSTRTDLSAKHDSDDDQRSSWSSVKSSPVRSRCSSASSSKSMASTRSFEAALTELNHKDTVDQQCEVEQETSSQKPNHQSPKPDPESEIQPERSTGAPKREPKQKQTSGNQSTSIVINGKRYYRKN